MLTKAGNRAPQTKARYVLHIGLPKTGTSFLQSILKENRTALREAGVRYPKFGKRGRLLAALDGRDRHKYAGFVHPAEGHWKRFHESTRKFDGTVVFSHEVLGAPLSDDTPTALTELDGHDADIVITARDPGRQLISVWQQSLRFRSSATFDEFLDSCDLAPDGDYHHGRFRDQQLDRVLKAWSKHVPPERIHVVMVPPKGATMAVLWERFCKVLGVEPSRYALPPKPSLNQSLGVVQAEYLRRANAAMGDRVSSADYAAARKFVVSTVMAQTTPSPRPVLPRHHFDLAEELADRWIGALRSGGYQVVGDLADLRPVLEDGPGPDDWTESDIAQVGVDAGAELLISVARLRGAARRGESDNSGESDSA